MINDFTILGSHKTPFKRNRYFLSEVEFFTLFLKYFKSILAMHKVQNRPFLDVFFNISTFILSFTKSEGQVFDKGSICHRCKQYTDIQKVTSSGRDEIENATRMFHFEAFGLHLAVNLASCAPILTINIFWT